MSIASEINRIQAAKKKLLEKMEDAGYGVASGATIDELVEMLILSGNADNFKLIGVNDTDRFITASGKYMVNIAPLFKCVFYIYTVNRGKQYKLTTDKTYTYANLLMAEKIPEYDTTGLAVADFSSGDILTVNTKYLLVSLTLQTDKAIPYSALTVNEI